MDNIISDKNNTWKINSGCKFPNLFLLFSLKIVSHRYIFVIYFSIAGEKTLTSNNSVTFKISITFTWQKKNVEWTQEKKNHTGSKIVLTLKNMLLCDYITYYSTPHLLANILYCQLFRGHLIFFFYSLWMKHKGQSFKL